MTEGDPLNKENASNGQNVTTDSRNKNHRMSNKSQNSVSKSEHSREPPDGGMRAWMVMIGAFVCNGVIFGFINTYSVIHSMLSDRLAKRGDPEASSQAALVGSLTIGTTFLMSPVAGCLTDKIGLRLTTLIGGLLACGGLFLSSFLTESIEALYLTYGLMFGMGCALSYTPTLAILGHYFKRYLGKVTGLVTAGSSVFTVALQPGLDFLMRRYSLETTLLVMSAIASVIMLCALVYKPLHVPPEPPPRKAGRSRFNTMVRSVVNVDIWKRKKYVIWAVCVPLALFGYFVPYVHMVSFILNVFPGRSTNLPVMCIAITSCLGRLVFGVIADVPGVNRIYLQQVSLACIGIVTLLLPLTGSYALLIIFTLIMGLFDGCLITLLGPIAYELCGPSGATQAIGFLLGLSSVPLTVGPPIAGLIYDSTGSYTVPFILAGIPPILGAALMFLIRCAKDPNEGDNIHKLEKMENGASSAWNENDAKPQETLMNGHSHAGNKRTTTGIVDRHENGGVTAHPEETESLTETHPQKADLN